MTMDAQHSAADALTAAATALPPARDRLPTLPEDLSEFAWLNTGPESWSAAGMLADDEVYEEVDDSDVVVELSVTDLQDIADCIEPDDLDRHIEGGIDDITAGLLIDLWHSDVPMLIADRTAIIEEEREAHVISLMDGTITVGALLEMSGLPVTDVLGVLCELCARGVVTLDRSHRVAGV